MAQLIYVNLMSLDGYIGDGNYEWSTPSDDWLAFITDVMRPVGIYLYGRKTYETMAVWETPDVIPGMKPVMQDYARVWQAADKVIYSKSLDAVSQKKARLEREFDPQAIRRLKAQSSRNISVGGPNLAAQAIRNGLVDEYHLFVVPIMLGGGIAVLPGNANIKLDLLDERRFDNGWVYLRYRTQA